jgi:hypothetical protein
MSQGFCPSVLVHINDVAEGNAPGRKMQIAGFLAALFCCQNSTVSPLNTEQFTGASYRGLTVKYRRRPLPSDVSSNDDCSIDRIPGYSEWNLPGLGFKKLSFYLPDDTLQKYCVDAVAVQDTGRPPTTVMKEVYDNIVETANAILKAINQDLVTQMATKFGNNVTTGQSNGKVINVNDDGNKVILDNGIVDLIRDLQENEICDAPCLVGGGLWAAWQAAQAMQCCSAAGLDMSKMTLPKLFFDKDTQNIWGPNTAAILAPGSVKFISRNAYVGPFAGQRGNSFFTSLPLPVSEFGCNLDECLMDLVFDMQLRYIDCPTTIAGPGGGNISVNRGWEVILSKRYALWVQPTDAYSLGDELFDTNGTLKYYLTNTNSVATPYAYGYGH